MNEFDSDKFKRIEDYLDDKGYQYKDQNLDKHQVLKERRMLRHTTEKDLAKDSIMKPFREDIDIFIDFLIKLEYLKKVDTE
jgi:hypothetical protein